jgi:hypothetical protein
MSQLHPEKAVEEQHVAQDVAFNWQYDGSRTKLTRLYENAKRDQWNATTRIDWTIDVDPHGELLPDAAIGIYGTPMWDKLTAKEIERLRHEAITWQLAQFLHGEQGRSSRRRRSSTPSRWVRAQRRSIVAKAPMATSRRKSKRSTKPARRTAPRSSRPGKRGNGGTAETALITGASRASAGARPRIRGHKFDVVLVARRRAPLEALARELARSTAAARFPIVCDLTRRRAVRDSTRPCAGAVSRSTCW